MSEISISTPRHQLKGYLATPQGKGPTGIVVAMFKLTEARTPGLVGQCAGRRLPYSDPFGTQIGPNLVAA
jgi:hypothetical protein